MEEYDFKISVIKMYSLKTFMGIYLFAVLLFKSCTLKMFSRVWWWWVEQNGLPDKNTCFVRRVKVCQYVLPARLNILCEMLQNWKQMHWTLVLYYSVNLGKNKFRFFTVGVIHFILLWQYFTYVFLSRNQCAFTS